MLVSFFSQGQIEIKKENQTKIKRTYWDFNKSQIQSRGSYFTDEQGETTDKHGKWTYYDKFGAIEEVRNYYKGGLYGAVVLFYPNGEKRQQGFFKYNRQDSIYFEWYENGELKVEGEYELDTPKGKWNYYYLDGRLKSVEEVREGTHFLWQFFLPDSLHTPTITDGNGEMTTYYSTGTVEEWYNYQNGQKHGPFEELSIYGYPTLKGEFRSGAKHGTWEYFYYLGDKEKITHYEDGKLHGKYFYFYDNGNINVEGEYDRGDKQGKWTWYTNAGKLDMQGVFDQGLQHGDWTYWYPTGEVSYTGKYLKGKKEGKWKYFYKQGGTFKEGTFENDLKNGLWQTWYEDGTLLMKGNYSNGKETGEWLNHWENGQLKNKTTFSDGQLDGAWESYHLNGKLAIEGAYKKDLKVGEWRKYFSNGSPKELLTYKLFQKKSKFNDAILSKREHLESRLNGDYEKYSLKDYKLTESGSYKNGKKNAEWIAFHPGGKMPAVVSNYKDGKLHGSMKTFSRRGVMIQEAQYKDGLKHGKYLLFDRRGRVQKEVRFSEGMRVIEGQSKGAGSFTPR